MPHSFARSASHYTFDFASQTFSSKSCCGLVASSATSSWSSYKSKPLYGIILLFTKPHQRCCEREPAMPSSTKPVFILVSGAAQTPSHYAYLQHLLLSHGYGVLSALLPTAGTSSPVTTSKGLSRSGSLEISKQVIVRTWLPLTI